MKVKVIFRLVDFVYDGLGREVFVLFVDVGGIVDHHCLNFLFIILCLSPVLKIWHFNNSAH
jgi:hypothetical protein